LGEWLVGIKKLCANAGICLLEMKSHRQPRRDSDRLSMPDKSFELPTAYDVSSGFIVTVWQFGRGLRGGHTSGRIQINLDIGGGHSTHLTTPLFCTMRILDGALHALGSGRPWCGQNYFLQRMGDDS
jgi:hypothetical protein